MISSCCGSTACVVERCAASCISHNLLVICCNLPVRSEYLPSCVNCTLRVAAGATSNGLHAAGDADAAAGAAAEAEHAEEEGHEQAPTRGRKKATGTKAGSKKGAAAQHAQDGEPGSPAAGAGTPPATSKAASASKAAKAAQEAAKKADAAREAAATHKQAAAAAAAEAAQHKRHAAVGAWVPAVCAVAAAVAVLTVFVVGTPQLLTAVNYNPASIRFVVLLAAGWVVAGCSESVANNTGSEALRQPTS